jgi:tRNA uridine 5-carboxymethylaminomethyl modification enzyme
VKKQFGGGRAGEMAWSKIYGLVKGRMKTGTPPRVDGRSLDYKMNEEKEMPSRISFPIQM